MFAIKRALGIAFGQSTLSCLRFSGKRRHGIWQAARSIATAVIVAGALLAGLMSQAAQAQGQNDAKLYFFTNDGCGPCLMVEPAIQALAQSGFPVQTVKEAEYPEFARQLGVDRTPTVVMIKNNRITHRHAGLIQAPALQRWFAAVGMPRPPIAQQTFASQRPNSDFTASSSGGRLRERPSQLGTENAKIGTKVVIDREFSPLDRAAISDRNFSSPTMHRGTARPGTQAERRALLATVKLRVEDPDGISFATGTVIHTHGTESLVMTCGHVFRDSNGQGRITAEYDFYGNKQTAPGRLVDYDSDARDVGLVVIKTERPLPAVQLADKSSAIRSGLDVFSIGCDHGENPTIRHTRIKNRAAYDGALKYDIFGRPVDGRSGGGLFTSTGELIGVCNSAAVQVDEGIYTALNTLHWQVATTGLSHLFDSTKLNIAGNNATQQPRRFSEIGQSNSGFATEIRMERNDLADSRPQPARAQSSMVPIRTPQRNPVSGSRPYNENDRAKYEVVIEVRSKLDPRQTEKILIDDPTPELIQYLGRMNNQ